MCRWWPETIFFVVREPFAGNRNGLRNLRLGLRNLGLEMVHSRLVGASLPRAGGQDDSSQPTPSNQGLPRVNQWLPGITKIYPGVT